MVDTSQEERGQIGKAARANDHQVRIPLLGFVDGSCGPRRTSAGGSPKSSTNVARHSLAAKVSTRIRFTDNDVQLNVSDNGVGFLPGRATEASLGIIGMTERAGLLGGTLDIDSAPGKGTSVSTVVRRRPGAARTPVSQHSVPA